METNGTQPSLNSSTAENTQPDANDDAQTALGKVFYSLLNKIMDTAKENSNSGA